MAALGEPAAPERLERAKAELEEEEGLATICREFDLDIEGDPMAGGSCKDVYRACLRRDVACVGRAGLEVAVIAFRPSDFA